MNWFKCLKCNIVNISDNMCRAISILRNYVKTSKYNVTGTEHMESVSVIVRRSNISLQGKLLFK